MPHREPRAPRFANRSFRMSLGASLALLAAGCDSTQPPEPEQPESPAYALGLSRSTLTMARGEFPEAPTVSLTRTNFTGPVTLSVENLPTGVTAGFYPESPISGSVSSMWLEATGTAAVGTFDVLVRGVASGLPDRTATLKLTVTEAPYTLTLSSATLSIARGTATPTTTINLVRNNYPGPVTLYVDIGNLHGTMPDGVTAAFSGPNPTTGNNSVLTLSVGAAAVPDVYELYVWSVADGRIFDGPRLTLTVTAPPGTETLVSQWAAGATASTEYDVEDWSAKQATGAPNVVGCTDDPRAWATLAQDGVDWLELTYAHPVRPTEIRIHEVTGVGSIVKVEVKDGSGVYHTVYTAAPVDPLTCPRVLVIPVAGMTAQVSAVRVSVDQTVLDYWNEIDAVQLIGYR